ncbi:sentrin-specific protease 7 isoform X3 [Toxotes jaculatrix]|uniref:sentrin-specific protease 7 isoform X3 n=1 Tax=Toxotes jaculatrix TaxID=941984 RepID=UPI001B3AA210|nr:sentrin-specific protease 7 isoform X3 [Toxotes jaculatrix]
MMEQRRALTIPFSVDKDNLMENPLKIPMTYLSSECGKLGRQVSWTALAGCKLRHCDSQHKNGSMLFDHSHAAMFTSEMARRKPCLVLTDVLKTELGKTYMERIKQSHTLGNRGQMSSTRRESGRCREQPLICRDARSSQREARNDKSKSVTPKRNMRSTSSPCQRLGLDRKRSQNVDGEDEEDKDIKEVIIGKDNGADFKFADVVDCGLSVSWQSAEGAGGCDEFSPASIKDKWTVPEKEVQRSLQKRKRMDTGSQYNGTDSPKRQRESVLRLTGEDGRPTPARTCLEESGEDGDSESLDRSIVQFTVGEDDRTDIVVPAINPNLDDKQSLSSNQDSTTKARSPSEPTASHGPPQQIGFAWFSSRHQIVLSSDDEESGDDPQESSPAVHTQVTVKDTVIQGQSPQKPVVKQQASDIQDMQLLRVVVEELPGSVAPSPIPSVDYSCMGIAFSSLHCGGYRGKANGDIMMADQKIIIPLKDTTEQVEVMLTFERKELRRYSVWEQQEMEMRELRFKGDEEPFPPAVLLFCVSDTAAAAVQQDLCKLCVKQDGTTNTGMASPFVLLTLRVPLEGMEGALLRSLLDIDCLNSLTHEHSIVTRGADRFNCWENINSPVLSLEDSIELIQRTELDSHLLSLLGLESTVPGLNTDQDSSQSDTDENTTPHVQLEVEPHEKTVLELETTAELDTKTQPQPEEDQEEEQELEHPSEKKEEPSPVYTLCHRRTRGSYSVSLCKPSSSWTKYKHQGLARRLIQFPPPPLKGGITVTMEDLQCLDNGQFLNDVIIDFYLKYLLQNVSASVAERSHIFSSFFYKQLTRRDNASEGTTSDSCQRQRRHQRVKTWTRHVDIFKKDFLFVPVNQEAHWYLVVICFPGLDEPKCVAWTSPDSQTAKSHSRTDESHDQDEAQASKSPKHNTEIPPTLNHSDSVDTEAENAKEESTKASLTQPVTCTGQTFQKKVVCRRPCILIMDSLKLSLHERVFKLLREYLQSEWEVRRGSSRDFGPDQMKSSHCKVPLQDNSSDCGLYLLQYVESFLKDPVVHFDLPLHLERWFPRQKVRRKRDEIRDLILNLYRQQNLDSNR